MASILDLVLGRAGVNPSALPQVQGQPAQPGANPSGYTDIPPASAGMQPPPLAPVHSALVNFFDKNLLGGAITAHDQQALAPQIAAYHFAQAKQFADSLPLDQQKLFWADPTGYLSATTENLKPQKLAEGETAVDYGNPRTAYTAPKTVTDNGRVFSVTPQGATPLATTGPDVDPATGLDKRSGYQFGVNTFQPLGPGVRPSVFNSGAPGAMAPLPAGPAGLPPMPPQDQAQPEPASALPAPIASHPQPAALPQRAPGVRMLGAPGGGTGAGLFQIPGSEGLFQRDYMGQVHQAAPAEFTSDNALAMRKELQSSEEWKAAQTATNAVNSLHEAIRNASGNNGVIDMAAIMNLSRAETGGVPRQGQVKTILDHFGVPQDVENRIMSTVGNGALTPQSLKQVMDMLHAYANTAQGALQQRYQDDETTAKQHGHSLGKVTLPASSPLPKVSWLDGGGSAASAPGPTTPPPPVGFVNKRGLRFNGGDPLNAKSWSKVLGQ